jgi:hypothetical protein
MKQLLLLNMLLHIFFFHDKLLSINLLFFCKKTLISSLQPLCRRRCVMLQVLSERAYLRHWPTQAAGSEPREQIGSWGNVPTVNQLVRQNIVMSFQFLPKTATWMKQGCKYNSQRRYIVWGRDRHSQRNIIKMAWYNFAFVLQHCSYM